MDAYWSLAWCCLEFYIMGNIIWYPFVNRKNMNVCKLKAGLILKTEYLNDFDEIYSADVYNLKEM